jgi:hypothetical protein
MYTSRFLIALLAVLLSAGLAQDAVSQDTTNGFVPMFDGKTLDGWKTTGNWVVEEGGVVTLKPRPGEEGWQRYDAYITTERTYKNFIIDLEFKIGEAGNSGVFLRVGDPLSQVGTGFEVQILDTHGLDTPGNHDCGGVIGAAAPSKNMAKPAGEWNRYTITCRGSQLTVILNGEQIIDLALDKSAIKDRPLEGHIGFQDEAKRVWYRNVRIMELPDTPPTENTVSLFDGKSLDGWIQKNGTATYRVEDGAIIGRTTPGSPNSFLCTAKEYGDFELTFQVKLLNNELNSGVQIRSKAEPGVDGKTFGRVNGPQVEIEATGANGAESGYVYGEACGGWMTPEDRLKPHKAFKDGVWNDYRIVAKGARIQTWINGEAIEDLTDQEKLISHPKGFIGLQVHGVGDRGPYEVTWRNIQIKAQD